MNSFETISLFILTGASGAEPTAEGTVVAGTVAAATASSTSNNNNNNNNNKKERKLRLPSIPPDNRRKRAPIEASSLQAMLSKHRSVSFTSRLTIFAT